MLTLPRLRPAAVVTMAVVVGSAATIVLTPTAAHAALDSHCQAQAGGQVVCTFSTPRGHKIDFTTPAGFGSMDVSMQGGSGGTGRTGALGGAGGSTNGALTLSDRDGTRLDLYIGGEGANAGDHSGCVAAGDGGESDGSHAGGGAGAAGVGTSCGGAGGGGGTFIMKNGERPAHDDPLAAAGGGGGGEGGLPPNFITRSETIRHTAPDGGSAVATQGPGGQGGTPAGEAAPGRRGGAGGTSTHGGAGGTGAGAGTRGNGGSGGISDPYCPDCLGGGGGGGGYFGGGGGSDGAGGGGGSGCLPCGGPGPDITGSAASSPTFHAAQNGSIILIFGNTVGSPTQEPPSVKNPGVPETDPNPNTNPEAPGPRTTVICEPREGHCHLGPIVGPDSVFDITASGGTNTAELYGALQGGRRPDCPNYAEVNSDWLEFGFRNPLAGSTWNKLTTLRTRHTLSHSAAVALSRSMQICFEAPYQFPTRPGFDLGGRNGTFDGVLADCAAVGRAEPCLARREVLHRKGGWVVRLAFRVPAGDQDPKALG